MGIFCLVYQPKLAALASGELPQPLAAPIERHLSACAHCQQQWAAQQRLTKSLRRAAPPPVAPSPALWQHLEAVIHSESIPPPVSRSRRLAPLGGLALAGAAAAALLVTRPHPIAPTTALAPAPHATPLKVAVLSSPPPRPLTALELAQREETQIINNKPPSDPFQVKTALPEKTDTGAQILRRVQASRPLLRHKNPLVRSSQRDISLRTKINAVAQLELGTVHIQTAEFNREVKEAEERAPSPAKRATCAPSDAIASARGEMNLGIFQ